MTESESKYSTPVGVVPRTRRDCVWRDRWWKRPQRCWRIRCQVDCPWDWRKQPLECRCWLFWLGVCRWRDSRPNLKAKRREALWTASVVSLRRFSQNCLSLGLVWCLPSPCINWRNALCLRMWWSKNPFFLAFSCSPTISTDFSRMKHKMRSSSVYFPSTVNHFPGFLLIWAIISLYGHKQSHFHDIHLFSNAPSCIFRLANPNMWLAESLIRH